MRGKSKHVSCIASITIAAIFGVFASPAVAQFAYVSNNNEGTGGQPGTVSVIYTPSNTVLKTIAVGNRPEGVAVTLFAAYVANESNDLSASVGSVSVIDTSTRTVTDTISVPANPTGIAATSQFVYVSGFANNVSVISTANNSIVATIPIPGGLPADGIGAEPLSIAASQSTPRVYTANFIDESVSVINTSTQQLIATIPLGDQPQAIAVNPAGTRVYTANLNTVSVIDTSTNSVIATITNADSNAQGIAVNPAGTSVYVTNSVLSSASVINTTTNTVTATIPIGGDPQGVSFTPLTQKVIWAASVTWR
jgi:YVTN family beta-propeller protein